MKKVIFLIFFFPHTLCIYAQSLPSVEDICQKLKTALSKKNGYLKYTLKTKLSYVQDTFNYNIALIFSKKDMLKENTKISLDFWAKEKNEEVHIKRTMDLKKGYFFEYNSKQYETQSKKSFRQNAGMLYLELPMIETKRFFERIDKNTTTITQNQKYYILKTKYKEYQINQNTFEIEKIIIRTQEQDGEFYETYQIISQDYDNQVWENDSLYKISKNTIIQTNTNNISKIKPFKYAPHWKLPKINSEDSLSIDDLKGKVILLDFWHTGCPPCIEFIPKLKEIHQLFRENPNFIIVSIALDNHKSDILKFMQKREGAIYPTVICDKSLTDIYQIEGYPTFFILDKNGQIKYQKSGTKSAFKKLVKNIKKELSLSK